MLHCLIIKEKQNIKGIEVEEKILKRIDELEKKYGPNFKENYGWTESVIEDRSKRNLKTIYESSNLSEEFSFYYKLSCNFTHATSFSLLCHPEVKDIYLANYSDVTASTVSASTSPAYSGCGEEVTSISMASGAKFYHIEPVRLLNHMLTNNFRFDSVKKTSLFPVTM